MIPAERIARRRAALRPEDPERGQAGGAEVLAFGLLVFVVGTLILINAWAVIDAKLAVNGAAREASRAYVESNPADAEAAAVDAARDALRGHGRSPDRLRLGHDDVPFERCARVTFTASYRVPLVSLPFVGGLGSGFEVRARHSEIIDPYASRTGLGARSACAR